MARKRTEIALQVEIETQEEWEEVLSKEGLTVVDVYQEWCGPCKGMIANFRRLKNELSDDLLHFAVAKADTVDSLERYKGRCEPCFLFYAGGVMVYVIRGANSPVLLTSITEQLAFEHRVLEGGVERKEVSDPILATLIEEQTAEDEEDEDGSDSGEKVIYDGLPEPVTDITVLPKGVTVAILKPNIVEDGKVDEVLQQMRDAGIEILESQERQLTEEEARTFYEQRKDEEFFEELVVYMTSGPCQVLVLTKGETGDTIVDDWRSLLGPTSVEEAKENAPDSLRAKYGKETFVNALHGSDSQTQAMAEMAFFFPDYSVPTYSTKKPKITRTLALIRPDALREKKSEILAKIEEAGFQVAMQKEMTLSKSQAEAFYSEHKDEEYFEELTNRMSSGPLLALALAREDAVTRWRDLLGPKEVEVAKEQAPESLRAQFSVEETNVNPLHGSDSLTTAQEELNFFFPVETTIAAIKPDAYQTKDEIMEKIREAGFHIAARKETELTREIASQFYHDQEGKEYYDDLLEHMTSGPTLFMVLTKEDAIDGWRSLMGPTDPELAKEQAPTSLRAEFGSDVKANALHGSSSQEQANTSIQLIFGDLDIKALQSEEEAGVIVKRDAEQSEVEQTATREQGEEVKEEAGETEGATTGDTAETGETGEETAETGETGEGETDVQADESAKDDDTKADTAPIEGGASDGEAGNAPDDGGDVAPTQEEQSASHHNTPTPSQEPRSSSAEEQQQEEEQQPEQQAEQQEEEPEQLEQQPEQPPADDKPTEEQQQESEEIPTESEENAAESEQKPTESEENTAESEQKLAESEENTAESDQKLAESEENTAESEQKLEESEENIAESEQKPTEPDEPQADSEQKTSDSEQRTTDSDDKEDDSQSKSGDKQEDEKKEEKSAD